MMGKRLRREGGMEGSERGGAAWGPGEGQLSPRGILSKLFPAKVGEGLFYTSRFSDTSLLSCFIPIGVVWYVM